MTDRKKMTAAMFDCYVKLYAAAEPSADFNKLMKEAPVNELGQKVIDFMSYEIDEKEYDKILEYIMRKHSIKHKILKNQFKESIALGCSPKFKRTTNE